MAFLDWNVTDIGIHESALVYGGDCHLQLGIGIYFLPLEVEEDVAGLAVPETRICQRATLFDKFEPWLKDLTIKLDLRQERCDSVAERVGNTINENGAECLGILDVAKHTVETLRYRQEHTRSARGVLAKCKRVDRVHELFLVSIQVEVFHDVIGSGVFAAVRLTIGEEEDSGVIRWPRLSVLATPGHDEIDALLQRIVDVGA